MKKLYTLLALCAITMTAFSQGRSVDLSIDEIISPKSIHSGVTIQVKAVLKNNGTDDLKMGDTVLYRAVLQTSPTQWLGISVPRVIRANDTIHLLMNINGFNFTGTTTTNFCVQAVGTNRSADSLKIETNATNNSLCEQIWYTDGTSGIFKITGELDDATVYPNPATDVATVRFSNPEAAEVSVEVTDLSGKVVRSVSPQFMSAGEQAIEFDVMGLKAGVYFIRVNSGEFSTIKKFTVR